MTAVHLAVAKVTAGTENVGHKGYTNNFVSQHHFMFTYLNANCGGTIRPNKTGMPMSFGHRIKLKHSDIKTLQQLGYPGLDGQDI
jgi:hypothetical protein